MSGFQSEVQVWMLGCFGEEITYNLKERNYRFLEEALELTQACGLSQKEAHQLVDYTFSRPKGNPHQEAGGVQITFAALCTANNINTTKAAIDELSRVWGDLEKIRSKQTSKPLRGTLVTELKNYEGDHFDTLSAQIIEMWVEGLSDAQVANLQQTVAHHLRSISKTKNEEISRLRKAAEPFTFSTYPDKFQSDDGGCTEVIICDEDVQKLRKALK